ncbi:MAG: transcriptional regulator NrdR [Oceanococcaceae bacterium]
MRCPFCNAPDTRVVDSRLAAEGYQVRRRRECPVCTERFTTFESPELVMPQVRKRGGETEPFDEKKLRRGLEHATYKTTVSPDDVEIALTHVMHKLRTLGEREVASGHIGAWVMEELQKLDQVAYVRFAAVYKNFEDVDAFRRELDSLDRRPNPELTRRQLKLPVPDEG